MMPASPFAAGRCDSFLVAARNLTLRARFARPIRLNGGLSLRGSQPGGKMLCRSKTAVARFLRNFSSVSLGGRSGKEKARTASVRASSFV
jgi:hypothetical protein